MYIQAPSLSMRKTFVTAARSLSIRSLGIAKRSTAAVLLAAGVLAGCASTGTHPSGAAAPQAPVDPAVAAETVKQAELAIRHEAMEYSRLQAIFWPLARAAAPLCPDRIGGALGPAPVSLVGIKESSRPMLRRLLGMDERLTFTEIVEGTAAARAGLKAGDILTAIDGATLPVSRDASKLYFEKLHAAATDNRSLTLQIERAGKALAISSPVDRVCATVALPVSSDSVSAFAAGRGVLVTRGMMRFANDRELAVVIAHEVAHIALGHTIKDKDEVEAAAETRGNSNMYPNGGWQPQGGAATGSANNSASHSANSPANQRAKQQSRELDADSVGVYLVAAAGISVTDAPNLWRRMAATYPSTIQSSHLRTHPASPERFVELERSVADVEHRLAGNQPLSAKLKAGTRTQPISKVQPAGPWAVTMLSDRYISPITALREPPLPPVKQAAISK